MTTNQQFANRLGRLAVDFAQMPTTDGDKHNATTDAIVALSCIIADKMDKGAAADAADALRMLGKYISNPKLHSYKYRACYGLGNILVQTDNSPQTIVDKNYGSVTPVVCIDGNDDLPMVSVAAVARMAPFMDLPDPSLMLQTRQV